MSNETRHAVVTGSSSGIDQAIAQALLSRDGTRPRRAGWQTGGAWRGGAGRSQYAATNAALVSLARSWAAEVVASGVTVNVVSPAATQTAMLDDPARNAVQPRVPPIGRLIQPAEVASLVAYLPSPDSAAITGQEIQVCGGASLAP